MYGTARQYMHPLRASLVEWENQRQEILHKPVNQLLVADAAIIPVGPDRVSRYLVRASSEGTRFCNLSSLRALWCRRDNARTHFLLLGSSGTRLAAVQIGCESRALSTVLQRCTSVSLPATERTQRVISLRRPPSQPQEFSRHRSHHRTGEISPFPCHTVGA